MVAALEPAIVVVPPEALPGASITVQGYSFPSGITITLSLTGQSIGAVTTSANGSFKRAITIPGSLATGTHTVSAQASGDRRASIGLRVHREITTHFYFAALYTRAGFHGYLQFVNTSARGAGSA